MTDNSQNQTALCPAKCHCLQVRAHFVTITLTTGNLAPPSKETLICSQTDVDNDMRKRGYKPAIYRGERVYCRNEALTGSNLESKVCLTAIQIEDQERSGKGILNRNRQAGCLPTKSGCN
jgi:hypothetical protein